MGARNIHGNVRKKLQGLKKKKSVEVSAYGWLCGTPGTQSGCGCLVQLVAALRAPAQCPSVIAQ